MQILEDKIIKELIEMLKKKLRKNNISSNVTLSAPRFVFVCGKEIKEGQDTIRKYTIKRLEKFKEKMIMEQNISQYYVLYQNIYMYKIYQKIFFLLKKC